MNGKQKLAFGKKNYTIMLVSIAVLIIGFVLMTLDDTRFGFGFLGRTLGPIIIMAGFMIGLFSILTKPDHKE